MERVFRRVSYELGGMGNYTILPGQHITIEYIYRKRPIHIAITENHPFKIPVIVGGVWTHARYAKLPLYIYKYLEMCGETPNPDDCLWCRMFGCWSPSMKIPDLCARFVRVDEFISNAVKMEFIFQNKLTLPDDLVPVIFSYLQRDSFLEIGTGTT